MYLSYLLSTKDDIITPNHSLHSTKKVDLLNNRYQVLTKLERRVLRDIMILDTSQYITELECTPSEKSRQVQQIEEELRQIEVLRFKHNHGVRLDDARLAKMNQQSALEEQLESLKQLKPPQFGMDGCLWLAPFLSHCSQINFINLSKCQLDNECIRILTRSLLKNKNNKQSMYESFNLFFHFSIM